MISSLDDELRSIYNSRLTTTTRHAPTLHQPSQSTTTSITRTRTYKAKNKRIKLTQNFSTENGSPLCMTCSGVVNSQLKFNNGDEELDFNSNVQLSKLPFQGRFCSLECSKSYGVKASAQFVRKILFDLELGVCQASSEQRFSCGGVATSPSYAEHSIHRLSLFFPINISVLVCII